MITIRIPATSANLGPGFDSIGMALTQYVTLNCEPADEWSFDLQKKDQPFIPNGKTNLIYKSALFTANQYAIEHLPPHKVTMTNEVPIARGLGSSSTAVVGGIELANQILQLELSDRDKLEIACNIEGHPDNVAPAIYGGITVSSYDGTNLESVRFSKELEQLTWIAVVPDYHVETEEARSILPTELPYKDAVHASGMANVLVAALAEKDWLLVGRMMKQDKWHQPYRSDLIPDFPHVSNILNEHGALGYYISGAGPTMIGLFHNASDDQINKVTKQLPNYQVEVLQADLCGVSASVTPAMNQ
ncbi:homoserine kinase [Halobacillus andaensis]|uniref:Homoserine kinase n=1 Tax=Halobacillus andaensis TaxID=1176239 RepID=A0A917B848_HALAA|nr:homoserine kinase [Halobacillus andaensis]MBP2005367.1 homoserine kinase [Halobacillus andaensis]GGF30923.1 homoserine kinase [Halobacillus andaensis]